MEDVDVQMGLYIIVVLCLIVIAMSNYKMAYGDEYMTDPCAIGSGQASMARCGERSDFNGSGGNEAPVFWNIGSVQDTNDALQQASRQAETNTQFEAAKAAAARAAQAPGAKSFMAGSEMIQIPY